MMLYRLLQAAFNLLYNQFAWSYDWVAAAVSAGQWVRWVRSAVPHLASAESILEVGHGPGHLQLALQKAGLSAIGVDLSPAMGRQAHNRLQQAGARTALARADARTLPFAGRTFDAVVLTFPAEYIAEKNSWQEFKRVLRPGGRILVLLGALPRGSHPLRLLSRLLFRITGQARVQEVQLLQERFLVFFEELALEGHLEQEAVDGSDLFYIHARHARESAEPAV